MYHVPWHHPVELRDAPRCARQPGRRDTSRHREGFRGEGRDLRLAGSWLLVITPRWLVISPLVADCHPMQDVLLFASQVDVDVNVVSSESE